MSSRKTKLVRKWSSVVATKYELESGLGGRVTMRVGRTFYELQSTGVGDPPYVKFSRTANGTEAEAVFIPEAMILRYAADIVRKRHAAQSDLEVLGG